MGFSWEKDVLTTKLLHFDATSILRFFEATDVELPMQKEFEFEAEAIGVEEDNNVILMYCLTRNNDVIH
jgi:hypothetical protein